MDWLLNLSIAVTIDLWLYIILIMLTWCFFNLLRVIYYLNLLRWWLVPWSAFRLRFILRWMPTLEGFISQCKRFSEVTIMTFRCWMAIATLDKTCQLINRQIRTEINCICTGKCRRRIKPYNYHLFPMEFR